MLVKGAPGFSCSAHYATAWQLTLWTLGDMIVVILNVWFSDIFWLFSVLSIYVEIALMWIPQDFIDGKSVWV